MATITDTRSLWTKAYDMVTIYLMAVLVSLTTLVVKSEYNDMPCVYQGHLVTDSDWYGFLANMTILTTGRISYEFSYPAESCCANILFYTEEQMYIINARMNCWDKEALLHNGDDQILPLSPSFKFAGCHMVYSNSIKTITCHGGMSFTAPSARETPTTYFIAVSNCPRINGLDLRYRLELVGHVGDCIGGYTHLTSTPRNVVGSPKIGHLSPNDKDKVKKDIDGCVIQGKLNSSSNWYGFVANVTFKSGGGFRFRISFPYGIHFQNVILYNSLDIKEMKKKVGCWERFSVVRNRNVNEQIIKLSERASWNSCVIENKTVSGRTRKFITCRGERRFNKERKLHIAFCNCRSQRGIALDYRFEVFGYKDYDCSGAWTQLSVPQLTSLIILSLTVMLATQPAWNFIPFLFWTNAT